MKQTREKRVTGPRYNEHTQKKTARKRKKEERKREARTNLATRAKTTEVAGEVAVLWSKNQASPLSAANEPLPRAARRQAGMAAAAPAPPRSVHTLSAARAAPRAAPRHAAADILIVFSFVSCCCGSLLMGVASPHVCGTAAAARRATGSRRCGRRTTTRRAATWPRSWRTAATTVRDPTVIIGCALYTRSRMRRKRRCLALDGRGGVPGGHGRAVTPARAPRGCGGGRAAAPRPKRQAATLAL